MPLEANNAENHACSILRSQHQKTAEGRAREWTIARLLCKSDSAMWRELAISEDDRQRMRAAWVILEVINQHSPAEALTIRRNYGHRRIIEAGAKWKRLEFEVDRLIEFIKSDLSTNAMCAEIENAHGIPENERRIWGAAKTIGKILTDYQNEQWVLDWARESMELFKSNGIEL